MLPYPPPWQDKATLCAHTCLSENTVDAWVKMGLLPPPRKRGGKLMWKWSEVDRYLENGGADVQSSPDAMAERIRDATRKAAVEG
jgi:predicted site-specific integrase-resolvase